MIRQYEDAEEEIPEELKSAAEDEPSEETQGRKRSWFSYMTFGLFD